MAREVQKLGWQVDVLAANRKMLEDVKYRLRSVECDRQDCFRPAYLLLELRA